MAEGLYQIQRGRGLETSCGRWWVLKRRLGKSGDGAKPKQSPKHKIVAAGVSNGLTAAHHHSCTVLKLSPGLAIISGSRLMFRRHLER
ncbi:unnamed protein product [Clonostachys solani]|uniref:Uncharacterized protein n=1 Tax=Clonostachys solani TaxID=160281 RepID=A0A9N9ZNZ9_9HYPO|nr:unnamed protein product [Clonostachys solani]